MAHFRNIPASASDLFSVYFANHVGLFTFMSVWIRLVGLAWPNGSYLK
jgi:hypothetical protein